jgi:hypothetical protein
MLPPRHLLDEKLVEREFVHARVSRSVPCVPHEQALNVLVKDQLPRVSQLSTENKLTLGAIARGFRRFNSLLGAGKRPRVRPYVHTVIARLMRDRRGTVRRIRSMASKILTAIAFAATINATRIAFIGPLPSTGEHVAARAAEQPRQHCRN